MSDNQPPIARRLAEKATPFLILIFGHILILIMVLLYVVLPIGLIVLMILWFTEYFAR